MNDEQVTRIKDLKGCSKVEITGDKVELFLTDYDHRTYKKEEFVEFTQSLLGVATRFLNERDALVVNTVLQFMTPVEPPAPEKTEEDKKDEEIDLTDIPF